MNYLRQLGVFTATVTQVQKKEQGEYKGKAYPEKIVISFQSQDGRMIDGTFRLPFSVEKHKFDKVQLDTLLKTAGVKKVSELVGKELAIFVAPFDWNGKILWNIKGYFSPHYMKSQAESLDDVLDTETTEESDEITF